MDVRDLAPPYMNNTGWLSRVSGLPQKCLDLVGAENTIVDSQVPQPAFEMVLLTQTDAQRRSIGKLVVARLKRRRRRRALAV